MNIPGTLQEYCQKIPRSLLKYYQNIPGTFLEYCQSIPGTLLEYCQNFPGTCLKPCSNFSLLFPSAAVRPEAVSFQSFSLFFSVNSSLSVFLHLLFPECSSLVIMSSCWEKRQIKGQRMLKHLHVSPEKKGLTNFIFLRLLSPHAGQTMNCS